MHEEELTAADDTPLSAESLPVFTNVADLVTYQANVRPDRLALVQTAQLRGTLTSSERRTLTWSELETRVSAVASGLASHDLVAGHRLALRGPNTIEFVVGYLAALRAGFVSVPINPEATDEELRTRLSDSGARVMLSATEVDVDGVLTLPLTEDGLARLSAEGSGPVLSPPDLESLAVLLYTAGTSGDPKAAMLTHRALLSHLEHLQTYEIVDEETVMLALLPLFHVFGLNAVLGSSMRAGATLVLTDDPDDMVRVIVDEGVSDLPVTPSMLHRLLQSDNARTGLGGLRWVVSGAAPLSPGIRTAFTEHTGLRVEQGYGLTEAAPGVTLSLGSTTSGPGHVGRTLPGVEVRIGDGTDPGEPAEIWVRGDNLFSGYWPTGEGGPDAAGWFATGDIGYLRDGELFLVDRARELIIVNGFHVYPAEVEDVILELPGVHEAAVIGRPDRRTGEQVVAFVAGAEITEQQILEHCRTKLARFKWPAQVFVIDELPRGATGKIRKGALRQLMGSLDPVPEIGHEEGGRAT